MNEFHPKVSIVIPVYNGSNYLREAVDSALAQTYKNCEILVVNDGSTDGGKTEEIAKSYGGRIHYIAKENGGVASALNAGIREMTGEYFSWLSHDDLYYPEKIEKQINHLRSTGDRQLITHCAEEFIDEQSKRRGPLRIEEKYLKNKYLAILSTSIGGCSLLIPKVCFERAGLFNENLKTTQDNEMWLRIAQEGFQFEYIPEMLVQSRVHSEQGSITLKKHHRKEKDDYYAWAIRFLGNNVASLFDDMGGLLLDKRCYAAHRELLRIRFGTDSAIVSISMLHYRSRGLHFIKNAVKALLHFLNPMLAFLRKIYFKSSEKYWEKRYAKGGDSGVGSFGRLASYKAEVINAFVKKHNIQGVIEFGCGDGNQLSHYAIPHYVGLDVSKTAIQSCKDRFRADKSKNFYLYDRKSLSQVKMLPKAELTLSVDVLYHLVEDDIFHRYLSDLFHYSSQYVIIYSTNFDAVYDSPHQRDRRFTAYIQNTFKDFELIDTIVNPHKGPESMSDFYIYKRIK